MFIINFISTGSAFIVTRSCRWAFIFPALAGFLLFLLHYFLNLVYCGWVSVISLFLVHLTTLTILWVNSIFMYMYVLVLLEFYCCYNINQCYSGWLHFLCSWIWTRCLLLADWLFLIHCRFPTVSKPRPTAGKCACTALCSCAAQVDVLDMTLSCVWIQITISWR